MVVQDWPALVPALRERVHTSTGTYHVRTMREVEEPTA